MTLPSVSTAFWISKTVKMEAMVIQADDNATHLPGQTLGRVNTRQQEAPPPSPKTKYEILRIEDIRIEFPLLHKSVWIESE